MQLEKVSQEGSRSEKQCSELRAEVADLTHKLNALKEKVSACEQMACSTSHNKPKKILLKIDGHYSLWNFTLRELGKPCQPAAVSN